MDLMELNEEVENFAFASTFPHMLEQNEEIERLRAIHEFIQEYKQRLAD